MARLLSLPVLRVCRVIGVPRFPLFVLPSVRDLFSLYGPETDFIEEVDTRIGDRQDSSKGVTGDRRFVLPQQ